jgi:endo-1,4-beta-xylanase
MLDHSFYKDRLGDDIRAHMFRRAHELDPSAVLFVNDYSILDNDQRVEQYIEQVRHLQSQGAPVGGIGVQMHDAQRLLGAQDSVHPEDVLRRLDRLSTLGLPIHLTEISSKTPDERQRADSLEALFRICFSHPAVEAILLWGFWANRHWMKREATLLESDFTPLPAGQRISALLRDEWRTNLPPQEVDGELRFRGYYGTYELIAVDTAGAERAAMIEATPAATRATAVL